ncbi:MAG: ABC transporter ATP-binding protein [Clostridia bacterium]|nr:ABC transporter ATP-binding protein [Clostridia bacterium]MBQ9038433.1 ABC transporter ATP-binding protein [Clostridia bacterium]
MKWSKYVKPYWKYFVLGPLCMIVEVVGEIVMPKLYSQILNVGVETHNVGYIVVTCLLMILTAVLMMGGGVGGAWFGAKAAVNFASDLRRDVYGKVQEFSFANIDKYSTGSLVTRLTNDITQLQNFVNMMLRMFLRAPGMLIGALIMAIAMNPQLARVLAVTIPVILIVEFVVIRTGFPRFTIMQEKIDHLNSRIQESLTNIRVVKSFVREDREDQKFREANGALKDAALRALNVVIFMLPLMMLLMNFTSLAVVWFGGKQVIAGDMPVGDFSAFLTYITQILMSLMMLSMLFMNSSRALASSRRVKEVMQEKIDLSDENAAHKDARVQRGEIEFRHVSFRYYKNSEHRVLSDINLKIGAGETVGIIGSTGCGKTTLVSMIPRLYDVDEGQVLVDGIDVKDYSLVHLREGVGMVLQKNVLFSGTIADNLRWGDENATEAEMTEAARSAQADGFIRAFAKGYETELDQGGTNVSGGQKQRLCIARALLKHPRILILDDSTSAVDTATEASIRQAFRNELKDSTKLIIAQRISSVQEADMIVVMDDGAITGVGTHDQLLATNKAYQEIYRSQVKEDKQASDGAEAGKEGNH